MDDRRLEIRVCVVADLTPELTACGERLLVGVLSAHSFGATESLVTGENIEMTAVYEGPSAQAAP